MLGEKESAIGIEKGEESQKIPTHPLVDSDSFYEATCQSRTSKEEAIPVEWW